MYTGYLLSESHRAILMELFPPKYERFIGHHITHTFGVPASTPAPEAPTTVEIVGYLDDGAGVEGFLVEVDGSSSRPDGSKFHITWSVAQGRKAVETNNILDTVVDVLPITISVTPQTFY